MTEGPWDAEGVRQLIGRVGLLLDDGHYEGFLALCAPDFSYRIRVWSPELARDMIWLEHDYGGLAQLFATLPEHLTRPGRLTRHVTVASIDAGPAALEVTSVVTIHHTDLEGCTATLAVGRYVDRIVEQDGELRLKSREVQLDTRDLGIGSHAPL
jgi:methanesulfonate monooxygenase small subunit